MAWNMEIFIIFITLIFWAIFYKRMIPLMIIEVNAINNNDIECDNTLNNMTISTLTNNHFQSTKLIELQSDNLKKY